MDGCSRGETRDGGVRVPRPDAGEKCRRGSKLRDADDRLDVSLHDDSSVSWGLLRRGTLRCRRHPSSTVAIHLRRTRFTTPVLREPIRTNRVEGRQMGIIAFIILGLLAGAIAKAIMPGDDPGGWIITAVIGVVGAILGGFLAGALFGADPMDEFFDISSWLTAIVGSIILLGLYRIVVNRGGGHRALRT